MTESSSVESWILRLQESDRVFYQQINEIWAQMGMPPAKPPSYDNKKQDPDPVILYPEASGSRLQSMEENLKRMKALVLQSQQMAASFRSTSSRSFNYEGEQEIRDSEHSDKEINANLEANPANSGTDSRLGDDLQEQEILELPSHGPIVTEPTSFSSKISELLSFKMDWNPAKPEDSTPEIVVPVEDSTPEAVTSKIEPVQNESFLDEYNLLDEMSMEDESEILHENCSVDLTNASAKVTLPSLTQSVAEIANEAVMIFLLTRRE